MTRLTKKQLRAIHAKAQVSGYDVDLGIKKSQIIPAHKVEEKPIILDYHKIKEQTEKQEKQEKSFGDLSGKKIRNIIKYDKPLGKIKADDFEVKLDTSLGKGDNVYNFSSKDGRIDANLFYEPKNVEVRGIIYGKNGVIVKDFHYGYPFAYAGGKPDTKKYGEAIARALNQKRYDSL